MMGEYGIAQVTYEYSPSMIKRAIEAGFWQETSLVYVLIGADESNVISIMNDVSTALNQNAIMVEKRDVSSTFYEKQSN